MTELLAPNSTDHSLVLFSLLKDKSTIRGKGFWKFNNSLTKSRLRNFCTKSESLFNHELKLELFKYEVRKSTTGYTKHVIKDKWQQRTNLENQLKKLERNWDEDDNLSKYISAKE